jgi:hypothetical protein
MIVFAQGARIGVLMICVSSLAKTASNMLVNFESQSRIKNLNRATCSRVVGAVALCEVEAGEIVNPGRSDRQDQLVEGRNRRRFSWCRASGWPHNDHFRIVTLPPVTELEEVIGRLAHFLDRRHLTRAR